jgi:arylsulfatase A-like enzyme
MRKFIILLLLCGLSLTVNTATTQRNESQAARPNIILIMADDQGYETIGANGGTSYKTPNIDRMAANGMRFENAYAHPLCTPSRVALMTGQYNFRNYTSFGELRLSEKTFGNMLRDAGYKTVIVGKWQLSERDFQAPFHFGFEEYLLWHFGMRVNGVPTPGSQGSRYWDPVFYHNGKLLTDVKGKFGPDVMADFVENYIQQHQAEPFFLYYPLALPHDPWIEPPGYQRTGNFPGEFRAAEGQRSNTPGAKEIEERQRRFAAMVEYTDKMVGRVTAQLEALKLSEKTLVIFTGDNGTHPSLHSNFKVRVVKGDKGRPTDAGTHVPLIAQWKGRIPAGKVNQDLIDFTDFLPTLAEIAGAKPPAGVTIDGQSFAPQLRGQKGKPREWIFCHYDPRWANFKFTRYAQDKQYKLYHDGMFFDYRRDPLEQSALAEPGLTAAQLAAKRKLQRLLDTLRPAGEAGQSR